MNIPYAEKYRPATLDDVILPDNIKKKLLSLREQAKTGAPPNLLFVGQCGVGKTTAAKAFLTDIECESPLEINGSKDGNIDTLRTDIQNYATSMALSGKRKYVLLDEGDYITQATQAALRNFMETFSEQCGFIITANYVNKIIDPLRSRCSEISFDFPDSERQAISINQFTRLLYILDSEGVKYEESDKAFLAKCIQTRLPDYRKVLNDVQAAINDKGVLDSALLVGKPHSKVQGLLDAIKARSFTEARKWIGENTSQNTSGIFTALWTDLQEASNEGTLDANSLPNVAIVLSQYMDNSYRATDQQVNLAAMTAQLIGACQWK